jgi:hypothetical protein
MEGYCSTGQSPQRAEVPVEEEEEEEEEEDNITMHGPLNVKYEMLCLFVSRTQL